MLNNSRYQVYIGTALCRNVSISNILYVNYILLLKYDSYDKCENIQVNKTKVCPLLKENLITFNISHPIAMLYSRIYLIKYNYHHVRLAFSKKKQNESAANGSRSAALFGCAKHKGDAAAVANTATAAVEWTTAVANTEICATALVAERAAAVVVAAVR